MQSLRLTLFAIFALSGVVGLIYETVWSRYIKLFLGHSAYAQTYVIAVFMGGMAIGAFLSSRLTTRIGSLLKGYAYVELGIGVFALLFHGLFEVTMSFAHGTVLPSLESPFAIAAFKNVVVLFLLLPPCVLLGTTFPLMSGGVVRLFPQSTGSGLANLYFSNSIGAAAGVLLTGFLLIELAGLPGTMLMAAIMNLAIGLVVLLIARRVEEPPLQVPPKESAAPSRPRLLLLIAGLTGLASFIYEIAWIRMLSMLLGSSAHAFELMLATFIGGLALGGLWIKRRIDRLEDPERFLGGVQWVMGILALITVFTYGPCFELMGGIVDGLARTESGYVLFNVLSYIVAVVIMFPAAFCAGTTLPLITFALLRRGHGERSIGEVYSTNTLGSILGVVAATHVCLPLLGLKGTVLLGAGIDLVAGVALFSHVRARKIALGTGVFATVLVALAITTVTFDTAAMSSGVFRYGGGKKAEVDVRWHQDGKAASVTVYDTIEGIRVVSTNGKPDASIQMDPNKPRSGDEETQDLVAFVPLAVQPDAKHVGVIGFGSGMTTAYLLASPIVEHVDTVEIEAAMVAAGELFRPFNEAAYTDPRSNLVIDDARGYFSARRQPYDIIVSEPSNPWVNGVASLFSHEFYDHVAAQLAPDGVLIQWIQLYELEVSLIGSIMKSLRERFPYYTIFTLGLGDIIIVARQDAPVDELSLKALRADRARDRLREFGFLNLAHISRLRLADQNALGPYWNTLDVPRNSDYFPFLGNRAAKARFLRTTAKPLAEAGEFPIPVLAMLSKLPAVGDWAESEYIPRTPQRASMPVQIRGAHEAQIVAQALLGRSIQGASLPSELAGPLNTFLDHLADCPTVDAATLQQTLFAVGSRITHHLGPKTHARLWDRVRGSACHADRPAGYRMWVELFAAAGQRDPVQLDRAARALVELGAMRPGPEGEVLLAASMLGAVLQGDSKRAQSVFTRHGRAVLLEKEPPLVFTILMAHAVAQDQVATRTQQ